MCSSKSKLFQMNKTFLHLLRSINTSPASAKSEIYDKVRTIAVNAASEIKSGNAGKALGWLEELATSSEAIVKAERNEVPSEKNSQVKKDNQKWSEDYATDSEACVKAERNEIPNSRKSKQ
eukprot:NODE_947_length_2851_cov_0.490189.p3 type:complete len:121 gc:universal NODE_947_length_2851_cov_0.490189:2767-2405(-)